VADISTSLPGGPTACDASAELDSRKFTELTPCGPEASVRINCALGSPVPKGIYAIEDVLRTAIPEVPVVEDCIDD